MFTFTVLAKTSTESATASAVALSLPGFNQIVFYIFNFLFLTYVIFLWWFLVRWVGQDAARRGVGPARAKQHQALVLIFTVAGLLLYFLLRPAQTLSEKKRAEMEEELLELELQKLRREADQGKLT